MRKRSRYRPRPVGRPIASTIRDELITPVLLGLNIMTTSASRPAQQSARDHIAAALDVMLAATEGTTIDQRPIIDGIAAFLPIAQRFDAGGPLRANGEQLAVLRAAVQHMDGNVGRLRTHQIIRAVTTVNAAIDAAATTTEVTT